MNSGSYRKMTSLLIVKMGCCIVCQKENIHIGNKMNSNFKSIFFIEANVKAYMKILFFFYVLLVSQNPAATGALLPKRLFFRSTIMKGWHRL